MYLYGHPNIHTSWSWESEVSASLQEGIASPSILRGVLDLE